MNKLENEPAQLSRVEDLMPITGFSRGKLYAMIAAGELPSVRSGRSVRVPLNAFRQWVEKNTRGGTEVA